MTVSEVSWKDALKIVMVAREIARPNHGFIKQLRTYYHSVILIYDPKNLEFSTLLRNKCRHKLDYFCGDTRACVLNNKFNSKTDTVFFFAFRLLIAKDTVFERNFHDSLTCGTITTNAKSVYRSLQNRVSN